MSHRKKVGIVGANGKMGAQAVEAVKNAEDLELVAQINRGDDLQQLVDSGAEVMIELTSPESSLKNVTFAIKNGINSVVGTSGWDESKRQKLVELLSGHPEVGVLIAPNFGIGSILETKFAEIAAPYFDSVEIVELHHRQKKDAPSGTAVRTAETIAQARKEAEVAEIPDPTEEQMDGARGADVDGVSVHAVRLPGLVAHQEVIFGSDGEGLTLRHDTYDRKSFMPGVLLGVREVENNAGLSYGLDKYMDL